MLPVDAVDAQMALHRAAMRAKAKDPIEVANFVRKDQGHALRVDASGSITNAASLVDGLKTERPEMFEAPVVMKRPQPYKQERLTCDSSEMTREQFQAEWRRRFPRAAV